MYKTEALSVLGFFSECILYWNQRNSRVAKIQVLFALTSHESQVTGLPEDMDSASVAAFSSITVALRYLLADFLAYWYFFICFVSILWMEQKQSPWH